MFQGSIVALVSPMSADGRLDEAAWNALLDWHLEAGTDAVVVGGTTGESPVLDAAEADRLLTLAVQRCTGRMKVLAGTGGSNTLSVIEANRRAGDLGADAALVVTPYYSRPPQRGLIAHYRAIADAANIPIVLYNVPTRTAVDLSPETTLTLADHEHIVAIKEAVAEPERLGRLAAQGTGRITVLSGDDATACASVLAGASGVISVAANVAPRRIKRMIDAAQNGDTATAHAINTELTPLYEFLAVESNPIPVKYLLHHMGRIGPGIRLPLTVLDPAGQARAEALATTLALSRC